MDRWDECLIGLSPEIANERRRVLKILASHESWLGIVFYRLMNAVANGLDLDEEMKLPIEERAIGFHWPDEKNNADI